MKKDMARLHYDKGKRKDSRYTQGTLSGLQEPRERGK